MGEDYMETKQNGHEMKDMYNPDTNTLDIHSKGLYPSNVLSNLCDNGFCFDGIVCGSMEGFLQSLKAKELDKQRQICSMKGHNARKMSVTSWQTDQTVWWKGRAIDRQSDAHQQLIRRAYQALFEQNENSFKTILTPSEFCSILTEMRDRYDRRDMTREFVGM